MYSVDGGGSSWPPGLDAVGTYLNNPSVRAAIHANNTLGMVVTWVECSDVVNAFLEHEDLVSVKHLLPGFIDQHQMRLLFYSGQFDLICNHVGTDMFLDTLQWSGAQAYAQAPSSMWVANGAVAGYVREGGGLSFLRVLGGSHMVPMDRPAQCLDMVSRFLAGKSYSDLPQNVPLSFQKSSSCSSPSGVPVWSVPVAVLLSLIAGGMLMFFILRKFGYGDSAERVPLAGSYQY